MLDVCPAPDPTPPGGVQSVAGVDPVDGDVPAEALAAALAAYLEANEGAARKIDALISPVDPGGAFTTFDLLAFDGTVLAPGLDRADAAGLWIAGFDADLAPGWVMTAAGPLDPLPGGPILGGTTLVSVAIGGGVVYGRNDDQTGGRTTPATQLVNLFADVATSAALVGLQGDVATLDGDLTTLEGTVTGLAGDVTTLQADVAALGETDHRPFDAVVQKAAVHARKAAQVGWRTIVGAALAGGPNGKMVAIGDSITAGFGAASDPTTGDGIVEASWPGVLRSSMAEFTGVDAGSGLVPAIYAYDHDLGPGFTNVGDDRFTISAPADWGLDGWAYEPMPPLAAGASVTAVSPCESFTMIWAVADASANLGYSIVVDGGVPTILTNLGHTDGEIVTTTVAGLGGGVHTVVVTATGTDFANMGNGPLFFVLGGADVGGLEVSRVGSVGATAEHLADPGRMDVYLANDPDVVVLAFGANDQAQNRLPADFKADLEAAIVAVVSAGALPVLEVTARWWAVMEATYDFTWVPYSDAIYQLAAQYQIPVLDVNARWGPHPNNPDAPPPDGYWSDQVHASPKGYADMAVVAFGALLS